MDPSAQATIEELIRIGAYAEARGILGRRIADDPRDWELHAKLGFVLHSSGEHGEAVRHYAEAAWILVIEAMGRGGGDAGESFEQVTTEFGAVLSMVRPACFDAARAILGRTVDYARIRTEMGVSLLELGDIPSARRAFCEAVEFLPTDAGYDEPWMWLTRIEDL
jgi:Flp pilus assembly protein TadD